MDACDKSFPRCRISSPFWLFGSAFRVKAGLMQSRPQFLAAARFCNTRHRMEAGRSGISAVSAHVVFGASLAADSLLQAIGSERNLPVQICCLKADLEER